MFTSLKTPSRLISWMGVRSSFRWHGTPRFWRQHLSNAPIGRSAELDMAFTGPTSTRISVRRDFCVEHQQLQNRPIPASKLPNTRLERAAEERGRSTAGRWADAQLGGS